MNMNRHVWESWTPQNFVDELSPTFDMIQRGESWRKPFKDEKELKEWLKDQQPYYKKHIPEVFNYFKKLLK